MPSSSGAPKLIDLVPVVAPYNMVDRATLCLVAGRLSRERGVGQPGRRNADRARRLAAVAAPGLRPWLAVPGRRAPGRGVRGVRRIETVSARVGLREPCEVPWARHGIAAYLGAGRRADAERVLGWLDDGAARLPCIWPRIAAAHGRALLAEAAGDQDAADGLFEQAMALHDEVDLPLEWLQTQLEYGRFLRGTGSSSGPGRCSRRPPNSRNLPGQCGLLARQTRNCGWPVAAAKPDPDRLTPAEQRVAAQAASGASNAEIAAALYVSVNTVETHLQHVYTKLGIRSAASCPRPWRADATLNNHGFP